MTVAAKRNVEVLDQVWTADEVKYWLREAGQTLRSVRITSRDIPSQRQTYWPEVVHDIMDAYGYTPERTKRPIPGPEQIDRMDKALRWLWWLSKDQRKITVARAFGFSWRELEDMDGRSERTLWGIHRDSIDTIVRHLNEKIVASNAGK